MTNSRGGDRNEELAFVCPKAALFNGSGNCIDEVAVVGTGIILAGTVVVAGVGDTSFLVGTCAEELEVTMLVDAVALTSVLSTAIGAEVVFDLARSCSIDNRSTSPPIYM